MKMFKWLKRIYDEYKLYSHIGKQHCFVFPILPKSQLEDGETYETFDFSHKWYKRAEEWYTEYDIKYAQWCAKKDCFIDAHHLKIQTLSYEEFKPLRKEKPRQKEINYGICSYNPCDINALDLEEIRKITFDMCDDNTDSMEVWDRLITYFEDRGF